MATPPFPAQDLAKLVLGYLIEEQLMTAYDEFLNESPYLDAQKNEYDRIVMNSLRNILGEYRAVKIYVESCKPVALRRRLFQCSNLLEVVKFLVRYVDVKKLQEDVSRDRVSCDEATSSRTGCDACQSLKLESCVCSSRRRSISSSKSQNNSKSIEPGKSIAQSTSLSDLPGNQSLESEHSGVSAHHMNQSSNINEQEIPKNIYQVVNVEEDSIPSTPIQPNTDTTILHKSNDCGNTTALCSQNIAEFNTVLNQMYNKSNVAGSLSDNNNLVCTENTNSNRIPITGSFQDFTTGVRGASTTNVNIPDSSTTENVSAPSLSDQDPTFQNRNIKPYQKKRCVFRVGNVKHDVTEISSEVIDVDSVDTPPNPKPEEQKVTILSNVRMANDERLITVPQNATSTPLLNMQTIYINGRRIFTPRPIIEQQCLFTKDEIMAMPTIFITTLSGPSKTAPVGVQPQTTLAQTSNVTTSTCQTASCAPTLPPLTVEVSNTKSNVTCNIPVVHKSQEVNVQDTASQPGLVNIVETLKNASVPKDNIVTDSNSTSTPHTLPPQRKSSSTPRRTSHVRILDFTTPRRIINETSNEQPNLEPQFDHQDEVMISKSPNVCFPTGSRVVDDIGNSNMTIKADEINSTTSKTPQVIKSTKKKSTASQKNNWDADLRALIAGSEQTLNYTPPPKPKPRKTVVKRIDEKELAKNKSIVNTAEKTRKKSSIKSNVSANTKHSKKKEKSEIAKPEVSVPSPTVSPIGIACVQEKKSVGEIEKIKDKSNDEERIVTPELERLYLRNEIGAKLNISDILETPYKQALYEIQMETPRFLGPELPDDPISDIKITDIPTPRFLTSNTPFTPKATQATPSSYSSRPTDYSSGGSYYKPDDQDYFRIIDDTCPVTSTHSKDIVRPMVTESTTESNPQESQFKSNRSRPVRQCTKNVSYYNSPVIGKNTEASKKDDQSCSDSLSINSSLDNALQDIPASTSETIKQSTRSCNRKNVSIVKKRSPIKKVTQKPFMKIKPRRPTPTKDSSRKNNKQSSESTQVSKGKRKISKEKVSSGSGSSLVVSSPTKSRRKSSTPRKLHCTQTFNSESSGHESLEAENKERPTSETKNSSVSCVQDSDTEQPPLRWSDDGSQDTKLQGAAESIDDEISKIKEYIHRTMTSNQKDKEGSLQNDLVKRGFDIETAKIIERDLLSTPVHMNDKTILRPSIDETKAKILERSIESDCSTLANNLVINEDDDSDDFEFSVHECNESSANYYKVQHDGTEKPPGDVPILKDNFSMEVCMEGVVVRLRASSLNYLIDQDPQDTGKLNETREQTAMAVSSISNMDRLYTPLKDPIRAHCYEIFDSTLSSIDTPLKANSPTRKQNATVCEIVIDGEDVEEKLEMKEKAENRKRKRLNCSSTSEESLADNKRVKPETQLILQTKDIQNMDIEVLLSKLHGS